MGLFQKGESACLSKGISNIIPSLSYSLFEAFIESKGFRRSLHFFPPLIEIILDTLPRPARCPPRLCPSPRYAGLLQRHENGRGVLSPMEAD